MFHLGVMKINFICKKLGNRVITEFIGDYDDYCDKCNVDDWTDI